MSCIVTETHIGPYRLHALLACVPEHSDDQYRRVKNSIGEVGLDPDRKITRWKDSSGEWVIIGGRARLRACLETNRPPAFTEFVPKGRTAEQIDQEIARFIKRDDLDRRHMTEDQIALSVARLFPPRKAGRPSKTPENAESKLAQTAPITTKQLANAFDISKDRLKRARATMKGCIAPIIKLAEANKISVGDAANVSDLSPKDQKRCLAEVKAERSYSLTAARSKLFSNRTGISAKTSSYTVLLEVDILAETRDLAVDMLLKRNEGARAKAVGPTGKPLLAFMCCTRCGKMLFEGDDKRVTSDGVACRVCPDGKTRDR